MKYNYMCSEPGITRMTTIHTLRTDMIAHGECCYYFWMCLGWWYGSSLYGCFLFCPFEAELTGYERMCI
ncbi:hypothetical protein ACSBR1_026002 [Camellia fascicularis]